MAKKFKINMHIVGILVIIFGIYLVMIDTPNYVGYIVALLGIALAVKPNAVKHLAYHNNNEKSKFKVQKSKKKGLPANKRNRN